MRINDREIKPYKITETLEEVRRKSAKDPKVLITDFDDTLVFSAYKHLQLILKSKNVETYKKYLNLRDDMSNKFLYNRTEYYTCQWLKKKEIKEIPQEIVDEITDGFNDPDFYKDVKPTKFATVLKNYLRQDYCQKIYVISHCLSDVSIKGKLEWLMEFYKDCNPEKIEFIPTKDTRKSIPVMERNIKWDIFADDRLECIYDMVLYAEGFGNEILIPNFGYNQPNKRFASMVENFNLQTFYIDVI